MRLRPYQADASSAALLALRSGKNPVIQIATGGGKSLVIADLVKFMVDRGGRVLVVTHSKELVEQNSAIYGTYTNGGSYGVYCGGLSRYEVEPAAFATIQSVYSKPELFEDFSAILVDEAHAIPPDGEGVMYNGFLTALPRARRLGFTATHWRMDGGLIYGPDRAFDTLAYSKTALELIKEGYLSPLVGVSTSDQLRTEDLELSGGDYIPSQVGDSLEQDGFLEQAIKGSIMRLARRKRVLVFTPTIATAEHAATLYSKYHVPCMAVSSATGDRQDILTDFKEGRLRAVSNVNILTTGFDAPDIDAIVNFRPTESSSLWVQMLGRGTRKHEGKSDCLVLDYAGNLTRLGGLDTMESWLREKSDGVLVEEDVPKPRAPSARQARKISLEELDPMLKSPEGLEVSVKNVDYITVRGKKGLMMLANYLTEAPNGVAISATQFVCVEYQGYARRMAERWFDSRGAVCPQKAYLAVVDARSLPTPRRLRVVRKEGRFEIVKEYF